jgi:hypothetical protein
VNTKHLADRTKKLVRRVLTFRRLLFAVGAVAVVGVVVLGTNLGSKSVAAQVTTKDVIIFIAA